VRAPDKVVRSSDPRRSCVNWMRLNRDKLDPVGRATDLFTIWILDYPEERETQPKPFFL